MGSAKSKKFNHPNYEPSKLYTKPDNFNQGGNYNLKQKFQASPSSNKFEIISNTKAGTSNLIGNQKIPEPINVNPDVLVEKWAGFPTDYYTLLNKIGEGFYGVVWKVKNKISGQVCAMKKIIKRSKTSIEEDLEIINEIEMMKKLDHPNMIKVFRFFATPDAYFIIMELCEGGELFYEIINHGPFSEDGAAFILYQILSAVFYCHSNNIIHRDLKPENILIEKKDKDGYLTVKVSDFGTAKLYEKGRSERKIVGSSYYIAPEVLKKNYDEKCDLWSCGVILYILLSGNPPFEGETDSEVLEKVRQSKFDLTSSPWPNISKEAKDLISNLLQVEPASRLSAGEALKHPWFKNLNTKSKIYKIVVDHSNVKIVEEFVQNLKNYPALNAFQQTALAYIVHNFPQLEEVENCYKFFGNVDLNGDGKITKSELLASLRDYVNEPVEKLEKDVEEIFKNIDYNHNGFIDLEEFVSAAIRKEKLLNDEILKFAFQFFDKDNSGEITFDEIKQTFTKEENMENPDMENQLKKFIDEIDLNKDGKISFDEFKIMMRNIFCSSNRKKNTS